MNNAEPFDAGKATNALNPRYVQYSKQDMLYHDGKIAIKSNVEAKKANVDLQQDTEMMILDYLVWTSTDFHLDMAKSHFLGIPITKSLITQTINSSKLVDDFYVLFKDHSPDFAEYPPLRFRCLLLRCISMFIFRHYPQNQAQIWPRSPLLQKMREKESMRRREWLTQHNRKGEAELDLLNWCNAEKVASSDQARRNPRILLDDILPLLVEVIAVRAMLGNGIDLVGDTHSMSAMGSLPDENDGDWAVTTLLHELLAEAMLQSALERYLDIGDLEANGLLNAFCWGARVTDEINEMTESIAAKKNMEVSYGAYLERIFCAEKEVSEPEWPKIRLKYMRELALPAAAHKEELQTSPEVKITLHLHTVQERYPRKAFEGRLFQFLEAMYRAQERPILEQLDRGDNIIVDRKQLSIEDEMSLRQVVDKTRMRY